MRAPWVVGLGGLALGMVLLGACLLNSRRAQADDAAPKPGVIFEKRCATCHAVPDPRVRADRIWLDQVHRTT